MKTEVRRSKFIGNQLFFIIAILVLLSPCISDSEAAYIYDNFNDNMIDSSKWTVRLLSDTNVEEINGRLELTLEPTASGNDFYADVWSTLLLSGDFDISVDYALLNWPYGNGVRVGLKVNNGLYDNGPERDNHGGGIEEYVINYTGGYPIGFIATDDYEGKLRLQRVGTGITAYYYDDVLGWMTIGYYPSTTILDDDVYFHLGIWSHNWAFNPQGQEVRVAFDNMTILSQSVPEPSTLLLFGAGLAGIGILRRRLKN